MRSYLLQSRLNLTEYNTPTKPETALEKNNIHVVLAKWTLIRMRTNTRMDEQDT